MNYHLFITLPVYLLLHAGLYGVFTKAGEKGWKAFIPVLNVMTWLKLIGKPSWWIVWFLVPVLNFIMGIGLILDLVRSFGKHKFGGQLLAVLFPYFYFLYLGFNKEDKYIGKWSELKEEEPEKGTIREWLDALLFAGTAALIIRVFLIEAFMIPTTSMEGSLLAGDFLFVSKFHYGVRLPMAPLSFPFVHNSLPLTTGTKSYVEGVEFPYSRLPGPKSIERNEIVVFNYPEDDRYPDVPELGTVHITSMKQHYIKRCVALPGDNFEIRDQQIYIDGQPSWHSDDVQFAHLIFGISEINLKKAGFRTGKNDSNKNAEPSRSRPGWWVVQMSPNKAKELQAQYPSIKIEREKKTYAQMLSDIGWNGPADKQKFQAVMIDLMRDPLSAKGVPFPKAPQMDEYLWTIDDFGPLWIPKAGETVKLDRKSLPLYEKIIGGYEGHELQVQGDRIMIDGQEAKEYTFEMDYYFMVGDNRHQSLDSRYWGFVPEDHIVGRPWFVLFSVEDGIRWDRLFSPVSSYEP